MQQQQQQQRHWSRPSNNCDDVHERSTLLPQSNNGGVRVEPACSTSLSPSGGPGISPSHQPPPPTTSPPPPPPSPSYGEGSLDFERVVNEYSIQAKRDIYLTNDDDDDDDNDDKNKKRQAKRKRFDSRSVTRWALTVLCSLLSGLTSVVIVSACEKLVQWRTDTLDRYLSSHLSVGTVFTLYATISLLLADTAAILCVYWVPEAAGSGIAEVKASLNGVRVKKFNSPSLLLVKMIGSVLSVASSLAVGMEGPLIFIGAIVGASLSHLGSLFTSLLIRCCSGYQSPTLTRLWMWFVSDLSYFANDVERRNLITIGAACGFAASFGTPIGGLLFILEDLSSFLERSMFLRILVANTLGTFCLALYRGDLTKYGSIQFGTFKESDGNIFVVSIKEIPFWIMMGIGGGMMGGIFGVALARLKEWSGKSTHTRRFQMLKISYVSLCSSAIMFFLPTMKWVCHDVEGSSDGIYYASTSDPSASEVLAIPSFGRQFFCDEGQINEMATIMFGSRNKAIVRILSNPSQFYPLTLFLIGTVFYVLMCITNTTQIPCGTFTPIVLIGASFGGGIGILLQQHFDEAIDPSTFALLGVAALMAGIQRSTVSTCVILIEGTGNIRVLLPVMIVVVIANSVAYMIKKDGIFETLINLKGYPFLEHHSDYRGTYDLFEVRDVMYTSFITLHQREKVSDLVRILKKTSHDGFPIVDSDGSFKGLVRRNQIVALIECGVFEAKSSSMDNDSLGDSTAMASEQSDVMWSPQPPVTSPSLLHWALDIKDDRYSEKIPPTDDLKSDTYDDYSFTLNVQTTIRQFNEARLSAITGMSDFTVPGRSTLDEALLTTGVQPFNGNNRRSFLDPNFLRQIDSHEMNLALCGDETLPSINAAKFVMSNRSLQTILDDNESNDPNSSNDHNLRGSVISNKTESQSVLGSVQSAPTGFAIVGRGSHGKIVISWMNPSHRNNVINLQAVMNRGTFSVRDYFPLSKAYKLFTRLGLHWIVVVDGYGQVVGMLNRGSLLPSHVKEKTGFDVSLYS
jgi:chloride channel 7